MQSGSLKEKLASMNDSELKMIIYTVCSAAGIERERANRIVSDIPKLRSTIMKTEDGQLEKLMSSLGKRDIEGIIKNFGK